MRALHIRTGESSAVEAVDRWLDRHQLEVTRCADAFDACVRLLTDSEPAELAFVGTDWLPRDEQRVFEYLREAWTTTLVVTYGADPIEEPVAFRCQSRESLDQLLAQAPQALLDSAPRMQTTALGANRTADRRRNTDAKTAATDSNQQPPQPDGTTAANPGDASLTREELSTLLDGTD